MRKRLVFVQDFARRAYNPVCHLRILADNHALVPQTKTEWYPSLSKFQTISKRSKMKKKKSNIAVFVKEFLPHLMLAKVGNNRQHVKPKLYRVDLFLCQWFSPSTPRSGLQICDGPMCVSLLMPFHWRKQQRSLVLNDFLKVRFSAPIESFISRCLFWYLWGVCTRR